MIIRPIVADDFAAWLPLWEGYLAFYKTELIPAVTEGVFERLVASDHALRGLVATEDNFGDDDRTDNDRLLGLTHFFYHPATWTLRSRCYLEDLFVAEPARGHGIGRQLIEAVIADAESVDAERVYWMTQPDNAAARRLYDSLGEVSDFVVYNRKLAPAGE